MVGKSINISKQNKKNYELYACPYSLPSLRFFRVKSTKYGHCGTLFNFRVLGEWMFYLYGKVKHTSNRSPPKSMIEVF